MALFFAFTYREETKILSFSVDDVENVELAPTDVMRIYSSVLIKQNDKEKEHETKERKREKNMR